MNNLNSHFTLPNAKPNEFELPPGRTALVMIDMQRDFLAEGGYGYLQCNSQELFNEVAKVIEPCARVLAAARQLGLTVIHTREGHVPELSDCPPSKMWRQYRAKPENYPLRIGQSGSMGRLLVRGEHGHDIIDELKPLKSEVVIDKPGKGSFYNTDFYQTLISRGLTHLLLCGVTTECCVATTFREANDRGFDCCVLADCTGGFNSAIVQESLNVCYAYDGLLGSLGSGNDLIELSRSAPALALSSKRPSTIPSVHSNRLLFEKVPFSVIGVENVAETTLCSTLSTNGAILNFQHPYTGSCAIMVDSAMTTPSAPRNTVRFSVSKGMISLKGFADVYSLSTVCLCTSTVTDARLVYSTLRAFDPQDPHSKQSHEYKTYHCDYRGVEKGGFVFSSFPLFELGKGKFAGEEFSDFDEISPKMGGAVAEFDWDLLLEVATAALHGSSICSIGPVSLELFPERVSTQEFSKYSQGLKSFASIKRKLDCKFQEVDVLVIPDSAQIDELPLANFISRVMEWASLSMYGVTFIAKSGFDGRLLDICQHMEGLLREYKY